MKPKISIYTKELLILVMNHQLYTLVILTLLGIIGYRTVHPITWIVPTIVTLCCFFVFLYRKILTGHIPPKTFTVLTTVFFLVEVLHSKNNWEIHYLAMALIYLVCYIMYFYLSQYEQFIILNRLSASNIPELEIFHFGLKRTYFFIGLSLLFTVPLLTSALIMKLINRCKALLYRSIQSFIFWTQTWELTPSKTETIENATASGSSISMEDILSQYENNPSLYAFWLFLEKILYVVLVLAFIFACYIVLRRIFRCLLAYFRKRNLVKDTVILSNRDVREHCDIEKLEHTSKQSFSFYDYRTRIRRLYRKRILQSKGVLIGTRNVSELEYMTPKECCDKISEPMLQQMYEKAKYSSEKITAKDYKNAKNPE